MFKPIQWLMGLLGRGSVIEGVLADTTPADERPKEKPAGSKLERRAREGTIGQRATTEYGRNIVAMFTQKQLRLIEQRRRDTKQERAEYSGRAATIRAEKARLRIAGAKNAKD